MAAFAIAPVATLSATVKVGGARVARRPVMRSRSARLVLTRATPDKSPVETAIEGAKEACASGTVGECAAAWDEVEELAADVAHKRDSKPKSDPLEEYCDDNPDADECRVYED